MSLSFLIAAQHMRLQTHTHTANQHIAYCTASTPQGDLNLTSLQLNRTPVSSKQLNNMCNGFFRTTR